MCFEYKDEHDVTQSVQVQGPLIADCALLSGLDMELNGGYIFHKNVT